MKKGFGAAIVLSASLALAGCNSPKPAMVNKTPAAETIMAEPVQKPVEKVAPKPDAGETHKTEVLKATPQPVKKSTILKGEGTDLIVEPKNPFPFKGSR